MQAQVERLVNNAKSREQQKETAGAYYGLKNTNVSFVYSLASHGALQHVLGKTSGRSYKAAPRQLLQIAISSPEPQRAHPNVPKEQEAEKAVDINHSQSHRMVSFNRPVLNYPNGIQCRSFLHRSVMLRL
jgi:DNA topoisomerase 2-associated protein PAT1